ncbi:Cx9C motif-containing protein [Paramyrothecium foliicola]|nr:Cx9C motif-containing protein [Paramyrothecium foliicola]
MPSTCSESLLVDLLNGGLTRRLHAPRSVRYKLTEEDCLTRNNYNEAKCQEAVKALYECCASFYDRYGDEATTPSCPKPSLLRLKLEQQKQGK